MLRYTSNTYDCLIKNDSGGVGPLHTTIKLQDPITLHPSKRIVIVPKQGRLSTGIPNIYSYGGWNNTKIYVRRNVADIWTLITLKPGVYTTCQTIEAAITDVVAAWYDDPLDPALQIRPNFVTEETYITIDSSKLAAGGTQMCVWLPPDISETLGYTPNIEFNNDGIHTSTLEVKMDTQTTGASITNSLSQAIFLNGKISNVIMTIPIVFTNSNEYVYPDAYIEPSQLTYTGSQFISQYEVNVLTANGDEMVFMNGSKLYLSFEIRQEL